jgi:hypothetical protein
VLNLATSLLVPPDTRTDLGYARLLVSTRYELVSLVDLLAIVLYLFGAFAVYAYLVSSRGERWALVGMVCVVFHLISLIVAVSIFTLGEPELGRRYLEGERGAFDQYVWGSEARFFDHATLFATRWLGIVGFTLFGVGIWRSGVLPQGMVVLLVAYAVLTPVALAISPDVAFVSDVLLAIAGAWAAWAVWRWPPPATEAEKRSMRVR